MEEQSLIDAAVELNLPPTNYFNAFDEIGRWQLETLRKLGLRPHHRLLDLGCGAMRLGLLAVDYLDGGRYFGIDAFEPFLRLADKLARQRRIGKDYHLLHSADFAFEKFGVLFDWVMAQSVFTHLSDRQIADCMARLRPVMAPGGKFLCTYLWGHPHTLGFLYGGRQLMSRPATLEDDALAELGRRHGASFARLDIDHPTTQRVGLFTYS